MEGGRGKGKGKKAKKKANAAAKKAAANHTNVQLVTVAKVSKAPLETKAEHVQPMTKAKRKRLKKQAAEAEKAKAKQAQQTNKSPTNAVAAAGASPKTTKAVAALTPPAASAVTVKPHVVSLTGKKKKRKRVAALHATESDATVTAPPKPGRTAAKTMAKTQQTKKTVVVLGPAASSPSATSSTKAEVPVSANPKRKLAKVAQSGAGAAVDATKTASSKPKDGQKSQQTKKTMVILSHSAALPAATISTKKVITVASPKRKAALKKVDNSSQKKPHVQMSGSVTKTGVVASPRKVVQRAKATAMVTPVEVNARPDSTEVSAATKPVVKETVHAKTDVQPPNVAVAVAAPVVAAPPQSSTTQQRTIAQAAGSVKKSPLILQPHTTKGEANEGNDTSRTKSPTPEATSSAASIGVPDKKPSPATPTPSVASTTVLSKPAHVGSLAAASVATDHHENNVSRGLVPGIAAGTTSPSRPPAAASSAITVVNETVSSRPTKPTPKTPLTSSLKRRRSAGRASPKIDSTPAKRSAVPSTVAANRLQAPQRAGQLLSKPAPDRKTPPVQIQATSSGKTQPSVKQLKPALKTETKGSKAAASTGKCVASHPATGAASENAAASKKVGLILDSHAYVERMMTGELDGSKIKNRGNSHVAQSKQPVVALPLRPQNAWGASFGLVPPAGGASSPSRTLSTTPLSSWFLSKGCANFVQQVHFSDEDDDDASCSSGDASPRHISTPRGVDKASPKRRTSLAKKNAFLESLTAQSSWRSWYGNVDLHNLLDPPLLHVPEELREHEVSPPPAAMENESIAPVTKKTNELESLEADIRREKLQGSAFSEQLLMMLQGKTASGKLLEEEYRPLLQQ